MTKLFAGPWIGEFGWELFCWQGYVRYLASTGKYDEVLVCGYNGKGHLYEDFAAAYIPIEEQFQVYHTDCAVGHGFKYNNIHQHYTQKGDEWLPPNRTPVQYRASENPDESWWNSSFDQQKFIQYGTKQTTDIDMLFHIRATDKTNSSIRNWDSDNWQQLVDFFIQQGMKIGCIGHKYAAAHLPGTVDLRSINLDDLCNHMASSQMVVGPSSGPMHLASLCGASQFVWSEPKNKARYEKHWNPFNAPVYGIWDTWQPDVEDVKDKILKAYTHEHKVVS